MYKVVEFTPESASDLEAFLNRQSENGLALVAISLPYCVFVWGPAMVSTPDASLEFLNNPRWIVNEQTLQTP